jgi:hypothetical protein
LALKVGVIQQFAVFSRYDEMFLEIIYHETSKQISPLKWFMMSESLPGPEVSQSEIRKKSWISSENI